MAILLVCRESSSLWRQWLRLEERGAGTILVCRSTSSYPGSSSPLLPLSRRRRSWEMQTSLRLLRNHICVFISQGIAYGWLIRGAEYRLMILCKGGFSFSSAACELFFGTGSCFQASSIVDRSRLPLKQSKDKLSFAIDGLWYSE